MRAWKFEKNIFELLQTFFGKVIIEKCEAFGAFDEFFF
jgi:hypothetical protein